MDDVTRIGFTLLIPYALLGAVDGLYLHLWRYRLHARADTYREHLLHTAYTALAVATLVLVYGPDTGGLLLWAGVGVIAAETAVSLRDVWEETASRRALGGLPAFESLLHAVLITLRTASVALVLAGKPASAWSSSAPLFVSDGYGAFAEGLVDFLLPGAVAITLLHVWLAWRHRPALDATPSLTPAEARLSCC